MTKSQLIERIAHKYPHLVERAVALAVNMMLEHMTAWLAGGGRIEIRSFRSFSLRYRRARMARNPRTGTPVSIAARDAPHFKPGMRLRERVDQCLETSDPEMFADGGRAIRRICTDGRSGRSRSRGGSWDPALKQDITRGVMTTTMIRPAFSAPLSSAIRASACPELFPFPDSGT